MHENIAESKIDILIVTVDRRLKYDLWDDVEPIARSKQKASVNLIEVS